MRVARFSLVGESSCFMHGGLRLVDELGLDQSRPVASWEVFFREQQAPLVACGIAMLSITVPSQTDALTERSDQHSH